MIMKRVKTDTPDSSPKVCLIIYKKMYLRDRLPYNVALVGPCEMQTTLFFE